MNLCAKPHGVLKCKLCPFTGLKVYFVDGREVEAGDFNGPDCHNIRLDEGEKIISVRVCSGKPIKQITFVTNKRLFGPYGGDSKGSWSEEEANKEHVCRYLVGIKYALSNTQERCALSSLSFQWLEYELEYEWTFLPSFQYQHPISSCGIPVINVRVASLSCFLYSYNNKMALQCTLKRTKYVIYKFQKV